MKLTLADIAEARAYERERPALRARIQELRDRRRVHLGPLVSVAFESRETVRYQVQEMVRAERILHDRGVQAELDAYNPLIPGAGRLSATLFIECTTDDQLREWLPKLVGIERHLELRIDDMRFSSIPEAGHAAQLTRPDVTAAVHYLVIDVGVALKGTVAIVSEVSGVSGVSGVSEVSGVSGVSGVSALPGVADALEMGPAWIALTHPEYREVAELRALTRTELAGDLRG